MKMVRNTIDRKGIFNASYLDIRNSSSSATENEKILLQTTEETETGVKLNESIYEVSGDKIDMI